MANKKKKSGSLNKNQKKLTVEDLKKKNLSVKNKKGTSSAKVSSNKKKSVPRKSATVVKKNPPKKVEIEKKSVEINLPAIENEKVEVNVDVNLDLDNQKEKSLESINLDNQKNVEVKIEVQKEELKDGDISFEKEEKKDDNFVDKLESSDVDKVKKNKFGKIRKDILAVFSDLRKKVKFNSRDNLKKKIKNDKIKTKKANSKKKSSNKQKSVKNKGITFDKNKGKTKKKKSAKSIYSSPSQLEREIKYKKYKGILKGIALLCVVVLVIEFGMFAYMKVFNVGDNSYDALNSIILDNTSLVSVGSSYFKYSQNYEKTDRIEKGRLVRYDKRGKLELEIQYDRGINSTFNSVVATADGYYVVGSSEFSKKQVENHVRDAILVKYSLDGKKLWEKSYSVLSDTRFNKIILVDDGLVVVGQSIYENMEMGNHTTGGGIIVKYDFDGEIVWSSNHGGNKSGNFNDVIRVGDNYYVVGKDSKDTGVLVKFSSNGKYVFHKNYSYTDRLGFSSITTDGKNLYVVGSKKILSEKEQNDEKSIRNTNNTDAIIVKYSLDGEVRKEKLFGGSGHDRYNAVVYFGGYLYLAGSTSSNDSGLRVSSKDGKITAMLIKCDTDLVINRKEVFGGSSDDNMLDLITDGSNVYMVGYSNSKDSNIKTEHDNGSDFISKLIKVDYRFRILMKK